MLLDLSDPENAESVRVHSRVVRIEELRAEDSSSRYEVGVVFHFGAESEERELLTFLERWGRSETRG